MRRFEQGPTSTLEDPLGGFKQWSKENYEMARRYEAKGPLGKLIMRRVTHRGDKGTRLESGRVHQRNNNLRVAQIAADNRELMDTWNK